MTEPDYAAVKVLVHACWAAGWPGRFFSDLRDKQGLGLHHRRRLPTRVDRAFIQAQLGTAPENVERAEAALRAQLARIQPRARRRRRSCGVAKAYLLGNLAMDRRTNARQAWYLASYEAAGVGYEFLDRYDRRGEARSPPLTCSAWPASTSPPSAPSSSTRPSPSAGAQPSALVQESPRSVRPRRRAAPKKHGELDRASRRLPGGSP